MTGSLRVMLVAGAVLAAALVAGALALDGSDAPKRGGERSARDASLPLDARAFVDTIGVNTHLFYLDTAYGDYAMVKRRLRELGVRHVRDGVDPGRRPIFFDRVNDLAAAGITSTLIACRVAAAGPWPTYAADAKRRLRRALDALEGVNEPDLVAAGSDWPAATRACQQGIYRTAKGAAHGPRLEAPVIGPSIQAGNLALGDIADRADGAAIHPYPGGGPPSGPPQLPIAAHVEQVRAQQFGGARVPVYATETGYHDAMNTPTAHAPASARAISIYLPRLFLEYARIGVARTFAYELVDERPDPAQVDVELNFGLFESDWSYKPSALALRNMIALLDSPRASRRSRLPYALGGTADPDGAGPQGPVKDLLLRKADGSYWLALWRDSTVWDVGARRDVSNPSTRVEVTLDRRMSFTSYRPTLGSAPGAEHSGRSWTVEVGDDVVLVKLSRARPPSG